MKKFLSVLLVCVLLSGAVLSLTACGEEEYKRMTVEANPSVEFILDSDNEVVSVTALNDDGEVVLVGEAFIGLDAEEAMELFVSISVECGYISKNANIAVSINGEGAEKLFKKVKSAAEEYLASSNISAAIAQGQSAAKSVLEQLAMECDPNLTSAQAEAMTEQQLIATINAFRVEVADLCTQGLRDAYYGAKAYEFTFAQKEETKKVIESLGSAYATLLATYNGFVNQLESQVTSLNELYNQWFVDVESEYQKALLALYDAKAEVVKLQNEVNALSDGIEKAAKQVILTTAQAALEVAQTGVATAGNLAKAAFDSAEATINGIVAELRKIEEAFPADITSALEDNAEAIDATLNQAKASFFNAFETEHKDDIEAIEARLEQIKDKMKQANK